MLPTNADQYPKERGIGSVLLLPGRFFPSVLAACRHFHFI
jgi:hypothetical protein